MAHHLVWQPAGRNHLVRAATERRLGICGLVSGALSLRGAFRHFAFPSLQTRCDQTCMAGDLAAVYALCGPVLDYRAQLLRALQRDLGGPRDSLRDGRIVDRLLLLPAEFVAVASCVRRLR